MPAMPPVLRVDLDGAHREAARQRLTAVFCDRVRVVTGERVRAGARLVPLEALPKRAGEETVVAVGDAALPEIIGLLRARPWLNHVVSARFLEEEGAYGSAFAGVLWKLIADSNRTSALLGKGFHGRQAKIRDSAKRERRIDAIAEHARAKGASSATAERIRDVAEELITNAIYDAPAERDGVPADRARRIVLGKNDACHIAYGASRQTFFLRVRDQCGSLRRDRLLAVLARCATMSDISLDVSRGGAGLGMWRIFSASALVSVHVKRGLSTDFVVGIDMQRGRGSRGRAIHLFWEEPDNEYDLYEVKT